MKTPGGLTKVDLVQNKRGRIVSKLQHQRGLVMFRRFFHAFVEARATKAKELGLTGFVKAKKGGTQAERAVYQAMIDAKKKYFASALERAGKEIEGEELDEEEHQANPTHDESSSRGSQTLLRPLKKGDHILVQGLASDQGRQINGAKGTIIGFCREEQRFKVVLDTAYDGSHCFQLLGRNLAHASDSE